MSYDALVWLLVGLGVGVAGSLMLLIGYAALERARLGRRLRKARAAAAVVATEPVKAVAVVPLKREASKSTVAVEAEKPVPMPKPAPVRPTLVAVSNPPAKPAIAEPVAAAEPVKSTTPVAVPAETSSKPAVSPAPAAPTRPQSVEAMFAEAFANDKLTVSAEPEETAPPKP